MTNNKKPLHKRLLNNKGLMIGVGALAGGAIGAKRALKVIRNGAKSWGEGFIASDYLINNPSNPYSISGYIPREALANYLADNPKAVSRYKNFKRNMYLSTGLAGIGSHAVYGGITGNTINGISRYYDQNNNNE